MWRWSRARSTRCAAAGASKATGVAANISDPAARKLVEWLILRGDHNGADSKRYLAFIAANPSWPKPRDVPPSRRGDALG